MLKIIRRFSATLTRRLDGLFARHKDPLLRGDLPAYAAAEYPPEDYPTAWTDIPADLRRPLVWDGRLLNGRHVAELAKVHMTDEVVTEAVARSGIRAFWLAIGAALFVAVLLYGRQFFAMLWHGIGLTPYPTWAAEAGVWLPIVSWYALVTIERAWLLGGLILQFGLALALLFPAMWFFGFGAAMTRFWNRVSAPLRRPTRDALMLWKANLPTRALQYRAYCREVEQATGRLADQPFIPVGTATGTVRSRGDMEAPTGGQIVGFDGESIRQHSLVLGGTGSGKTRLVIRPLFDRIMSAAWGAGHRIGAYVTDGKGTLWRDLMPFVADRKDVAILGTGADHAGVDLVKGMSPLEVATTFKAVSGQVAGKPSDDFWPESASLLLMHAAIVARALDSHPATVAEWIEQKAARPYSLLGIALLASEEKAAREAFERVASIADELAEREGVTDEEKAPLLEAFTSIEWLDGSFLPMAQETKSSIIANVNVVLGKLQGAVELSRRFCRGTCERTVDVDHALRGGVLMIAVGETEHGMAGKVVNCWLKTRLYILARRRLLDDPEGCRSTSCALFADEFQMLATTGQDSDSTFWNIARETGVFMVAATQSLAALKQVIGEDATANLVNLLRSKIVLKTEELSTLDFVRRLSGEAPRGWETDEGFYASQTAREIAVGNVGETRVDLGWLGGIWPRYVRFTTSPDAIYDYRIRGGSREHKASMVHQLNFRKEDRHKSALTEGVTFRPKVETDELLLGSGMAFAVIQRAGGDRMDILDLQLEAA